MKTSDDRLCCTYGRSRGIGVGVEEVVDGAPGGGPRFPAADGEEKDAGDDDDWEFLPKTRFRNELILTPMIHRDNGRQT